MDTKNTQNMKKIKDMIRRCRFGIMAALCGFLSVPALAQSAEPPAAFDDALSTLQDGVTSMIDKIVPVVAAILVALLVFVGLFMAWRYVKKAAK